jgi:hypothetical protein
MESNQDQYIHTSPEERNEEQVHSQDADKNRADAQANRTESQKRFDRGTDMDFFEMSSQNEHPGTEEPNKDVATNDGSVVETLDTAFHDVPGFHGGENLSGSNRADYYEARSQSKSDTEEELEVRNRDQGREKKKDGQDK